MKVLLVNGSPSKNGCTNRALEEIKVQLQKEGVEAEIFWIGTKNQGCVACGRCGELGHCVFNDNVVEFAELAKGADGFVFGSPVYFSGAAGGLQCFMDRLFYSAGDILENKPAAAIVSCRRGGATESFARLNMYFAINNMPVVSSQYWNQVHGNTPQEVEQDKEGLQAMRTLAVNMAWLLKCIEAGKKDGVTTPQREDWLPTNFIR